VLDPNGRVLGPRALRTRERLLRATARRLAERPLREISVIEIARSVGTSPATFYQYFRDVGDATLALAEEAAAEMPSVLARIDGPWAGRRGLATARSVVEAFIEHWDAHHAVLRVRNLAAEEGDRRFQRVRAKALAPALGRLARSIAAARDAGRVAPQVHPQAAAAALLAILERLAAYHAELEPIGVSRKALVETCARILHQTVTGRAVRGAGRPARRSRPGARARAG
jgi:AcrR family transcriptional regulator